VYDEVSYLAGAGAQATDSAEEKNPSSGHGSFPSRALPRPGICWDIATQWRRRAVGAAALVGTVAALGALAALDGVVSHRAQRSRREVARARGSMTSSKWVTGASQVLARLELGVGLALVAVRPSG